jgi:hypothetical protein
MYVIKKGRYYVANPGSVKSYTNSLDRAQKFYTREAAIANKCGNEYIVNMEYITKEIY